MTVIEDVYYEADGKIAIDFGGQEVLLTQEEALNLYMDLGYVLQDLDQTFNVQQKVNQMSKKIIVNPIGRKNLQFRRTTDRYAPKGTFSSNQGYLSVSKNELGQFCSRPAS